MDTQALIEAAESGATNTVEQLLKSGVDANARPNNGTTALIRAASNNHAETVRVLLDNGADINATRNDGMTPLILAAFFGHTGVAALLLEKGADLSAKDQLGSTALQWASSRGHKETFELLKNASAGKVKSAIPMPSESFSAVVAAPVEAEKLSSPGDTESARGENPLDDSFEGNVLELDGATHTNSAFASPDEPIELDELDADFDETTIITPQVTARVAPVAPPVLSPALPSVATRRIPPPATSSHRSNARLLALAWLIIFSVSAALTYALTKSSSVADGQAATQEIQNQPAPSDNTATQNTQPTTAATTTALPPVEKDEKEQPKLTSSVPTPSPVQFTGEQPAAANGTNARERKSKSRDEAPQVVESVRREAASNEPESRPAAPKPTPSPKRDDDDLRARTEAAAAPPRAPAQSSPPPRNPEASAESQSSRSNSSAPRSKRKSHSVALKLSGGARDSSTPINSLLTYDGKKAGSEFVPTIRRALRIDS